MHLLVGLGNPGSEYLNTRHNLGFEIIDEIAYGLRVKFVPAEGESLVAFGSIEHNDVALVKPLTYMNNSGYAVSALTDSMNVRLESLLVICDDFQLPLGSLRMRTAGSDGGHNGLYSIIESLQSDAFPRLRCGISSDSMPREKWRMKEFVLDQFSPGELPTVRSVVQRGRDACVCYVAEGISRAMNIYNQKPDA